MKTIQQLMQSDFVYSSHYYFSMSKFLCSCRSHLSFELNESSFSVGILAVASILSWIFVYNTMYVIIILMLILLFCVIKRTVNVYILSRIYLCALFVNENVIYLTDESFLSLIYCHQFFFETHETANFKLFSWISCLLPNSK